MSAAKASTRAVLLDYDGVLFRSRAADACIHKRCVDFCASVASITEVDRARRLNQAAYGVHGHTALGLVRLGYGSSSARMMRDFNAAVYSGLKTSDYASIVRATPDADVQRRDMLRLFDACRGVGADVFVFSNAPPEWIFGICNALDVDVTRAGVVVLRDACRKSPKPDASAYRRAERELLAVHPRRRDVDRVLFVDDNKLNLWPAAGPSSARLFLRWECVHYVHYAGHYAGRSNDGPGVYGGEHGGVPTPYVACSLDELCSRLHGVGSYVRVATSSTVVMKRSRGKES